MVFANVATLSHSMFEAAGESGSISLPRPLRYGVEEPNRFDEMQSLTSFRLLTTPGPIWKASIHAETAVRVTRSTQTQGSTTLTAWTLLSSSLQRCSYRAFASYDSHQTHFFASRTSPTPNASFIFSNTLRRPSTIRVCSSVNTLPKVPSTSSTAQRGAAPASLV